MLKMFKIYDTQCRVSLKEVVDMRSLEAPNPHQIRQLGLGELALDSVVDTIRSFNQDHLGGRPNRIHQWVTWLTKKIGEHVEDQDENFFVFSYNDVEFHVSGYFDDDAGVFTFCLRTSSSYFNDGPSSSAEFNSETANHEEFYVIAHKIVETVRNEIFCEVCGQICKDVYSTLGRGICRGCSKYFNEPGCRVCKNPFGELEDGIHKQCSKRRRIN